MNVGRKYMEKKYRILVVEDEKLLLEAIVKKLTLSGFDVTACASGNEAISYLDRQSEVPDVIWLDYYLKDTNGLDFLQMLKKQPKTTGIPVLVVSNSASEKNVHTMLALGAFQYVLKSEYRLDEIIAMIVDFIKKKHEKDSHR